MIQLKVFCPREQTVILGTGQSQLSFTCGAAKIGCCHVDGGQFGSCNRIDPEHCNNQPVLAWDIKAG
jgi:hypothetical protein